MINYSVIIPLYNKAATIERAVKSVLNQSVQDFEILVVNDGSTDNGSDIVLNILDARIKLISQQNQGVSAARNKGINDAKYEMIAFLDADDEWDPKFLEEILYLKNKYPACDVFAANYVFKKSDTVLFKTIIKGLPSIEWEGVVDDYFLVGACSDPLLCASAVCVTKRAIKTIGGFPVGIDSGEDLITWAKLACKYKIAYTTKPLSFFWTGIMVNTKPRLPQIPDVVGYDLETLALSISDNERSSILKYISLWHRMRANSFIRLGMRKEAIHEIKNIFKHNKLSVIVPIYTIFLFMPTKIFDRVHLYANSQRRYIKINNHHLTGLE